MKKHPAQNVDTGRRRLLAGTAAVAGLALSSGILAPGIFLIAPAQAKKPGDPVSGKTRWGLLIDVNKLNDASCDALVAACKAENGWEGSGKPATDPQWIRRVNVKDKQTGRTASVPVMCQHCENPPCQDVCPTGASFRRADGIVLVDRHICIGCRYCMMACPYKARSLVFDAVENQKPQAPRGKGTVEGCTLCVHRIDEGRQPACVEAAAEAAPGAVIFGDLNDPGSAISKAVASVAVTRIRGDLGLEPGVLYRGL
jgi:tetrathionate reductase subunit B